jgi:kynureninase
MPDERHDEQPGQTDSDLLRWREEFPILSSTTYLSSNSLGAMPRAVYDSLRQYADTWATRGVRAWGEGWWEMNTRVGDKAGAIIGAPSGSVSMHMNISLAMGILLTCFDYDGPRNKVVIEAGIFPSVYYVLREMLPRHIELVMVPSDDGITVPTQRIIDAIDERTLIVLISHVLFRSAYIVDVKAITEKAHAVGATVIVDGYHAAGIIPVDVTALNVDFYLGGVLKWLCGGPGGVFLYARPDHLRTVHPKLTGWMAHRRPFDFEVAPIDLREDAFRFMNGTPAIPSLHANEPGLDIIGAVGSEAIRRKSMRQTAIIVARAQAAGHAINSPLNPSERAGTVSLEPDPERSYAIAQELIARDILVDYRPGAGIRLAPHFYNTDAEVHTAMDAIADIMDSGAWQRHMQPRSFVT